MDPAGGRDAVPRLFRGGGRRRRKADRHAAAAGDPERLLPRCRAAGLPGRAVSGSDENFRHIHEISVISPQLAAEGEGQFRRIAFRLFRIDASSLCGTEIRGDPPLCAR